MSIEIIVPGRFVETKDPLEFRSDVEGWFTLSAIRDGNVVRSRQFHNLFLNQGLDRLATIQPGTLWPRVHVGTGTTPPAPTDTGLVNYLGFIQSATNTAGNSGAPDYYSWTRLSWLSAIGAFGTTNLT